MAYRRWIWQNLFSEDDCIEEISYEIHPSLNYNRRLIENAMQEIENYSRIEFVPRTRRERCYLKITKGDGCWFEGEGECIPRISLGIGCRNFGTILHELMHAIGFEHEHRRPDRNRYLKIHWNNIESENKSQFQKLRYDEYEWNDFQIDYKSIMMYDSYAFSKNDFVTIEMKNGAEIGVNKRLSYWDKEKLNLL
ncbi:zinc metalloproteinase nas-7 [Nephila pilipes]|uniref:Metalloendopeptidase n=1 Tax=Nephila pilipes TaxID=299642 RepID=A0A8X6T9Q5_NEPPI|nr:zinc metalloproteinase nas-7 [Nephila pilipes]